jgi:hypothetical protein
MNECPFQRTINATADKGVEVQQQRIQERRESIC